MLIFKYLHLCNDIFLRLVLIFMSRLVTYNKENSKPLVILHIIIFVTNNWWVYLPKPHDQWKCPYLGQLAPHSWNRIIRMAQKRKLFAWLSIFGKLPTYPSPKPTLTLTSHLGRNVGFREGHVGRWAWGEVPERLVEPRKVAKCNTQPWQPWEWHPSWHPHTANPWNLSYCILTVGKNGRE